MSIPVYNGDLSEMTGFVMSPNEITVQRDYHI